MSSLTCNGATVSFSGSSFSCDVTLTPGLNFIAVRATDLAGSVALTKLHVTYPVYPVPTSIQITPINVSLGVGQTQQFTAIDNLGYPRPDATWSLPRRTNAASITTGSSPVLTALAVGQVTLTATVQGHTAQTVINVVTTAGSSNWTVPPLSGLMGWSFFSPATPSDSVGGLYSQEASMDGSNYALRGLTTTGQQLWQQIWQIGSPNFLEPMAPDLNGGLLVATFDYPNNGMSDLDSETGSTIWHSNFTGQWGTVRADGNIVALGQDAHQPTSPLSIVIVNGITGQSTQIAMPEKSMYVTSYSGCRPGTTTSVSDASIGNTITTDVDGNAYFEYVIVNTSEAVVRAWAQGYCVEVAAFATRDSKLSLMTISPDGSLSTRVLATRTETVTCCGSVNSWNGSILSAGSVTPDGQGGVLATWSELVPDAPSSYMVSHVTATGQNDFHLSVLDKDGAYDVGIGTVVLDDGGTGFVTNNASASALNTIVAFDINTGQQIWAVQPGIAPYLMFAQDGGGVIVKGWDSNNYPKLTSIDASGNIGPMQSLNLPFAVNPASAWPGTFGNPSQNGLGVPGCPCLVQSSDASAAPQTDTLSTNESSAPSEAIQTQGDNSSVSQLLGPSNCPICNLPPREPSQPPQCVTFPGSGATYLILVGDPGLGGHDLRDLFNLAAQTKANDLVAHGSKVIACRISSVTDFNFELTNNGLITGDVIYFGHSGEGHGTLSDGTKVMVTGLFIGEQADPDSNLIKTEIGPGSYRNLCGTGCNIDNFLSKNSAIRLNGCEAGADLTDYYKQYPISIAKLISNQLNRGVYAYTVGVYFSQLDADHDKLFAPTKLTKNPPDSLPMYAVPEGTPGHKPSAQPFCPGGKCQ